MPESEYLISVASHGMTSDFVSLHDDLLDAVVAAKELMQSPAQRRITISIVNMAQPKDWPWPMPPPQDA